jgi:dipeptidyl-peptidase-4
MINTNDSIYAFNIPVEYPKVGEAPCAELGCKYDDAKTTWMNVPGDVNSITFPHGMDGGTVKGLVATIESQNKIAANYFKAKRQDGAAVRHSETDEAWVDIQANWESGMAGSG